MRRFETISILFVMAYSFSQVSLAEKRSDDYLVSNLLKPCIEGDNDARDGTILEMECEQYISGFADLYVSTGMAKNENVCLPMENRLDEVRWAFTSWAHRKFEHRGFSAVDGILATVRTWFQCK